MATATPRESTMPRWQRALLPAVEGSAATGSPLRRTARDWLVDIVVFTFAVAYGAAGLHEQLSSASVAEGLLEVLLGMVACLSLWVRRRSPLTIGILTASASAVSAGARGAALAGVFTVAVHCAPRWTAWVGGLSVLASSVNAAIDRPEHHYAWNVLEVGLVSTTLAIGYGLYVHARRELVLSLRERAHRLESEQDLRVREARQAERTRIAGEMHDVLAHRISLLSVHAGALEYNPAASPAEIAAAAAVIRTSARAAQEELREVIGILRDDGGDSDGLPPPQPTVTALPALVEESRRAGMEVTYRDQLDAVSVPTLLGRTAYRVVQEGLTNARKHAPGQSVAIDIGGRPGGELAIEVVNRPRVGRAQRDGRHAESGTGLIGLGERVGLVGGHLSHGARPDGGFVLTADPAVAGMSSAAPIRVVIVDDDALVRSGLTMMLGGAPGVAVVGEAQDGTELLGAIDRHRPDVVLLDLRMPKLDGLGALALLRGQPRPPAVIVLTTFDTEEHVLPALRAGAAGFLVKDTPPAEIVRAIELVASGESMLSPTVTRRLHRAPHRARRRRRGAAASRRGAGAALPA